MTTDSAVAELRGLLFAAGWDVQPNRRVLCPVRGAFVEVASSGRKVHLLLPSETRTVAEIGRTVRVQRPPSAVVNGVTLVSWDAALLRREDVRERAAALVAGVGSARGVVSLVLPYQEQVGVRVGGVTVIESRVRPGEPWVVQVKEDPQPKSSSVAAAGWLMLAAAMSASTRR